MFVSQISISCAVIIISIGVSTAYDLNTWRDDLPWANLASNLSPESSLIDTSPANFLNECAAEFEKPYTERTNYALIDQPSGLCMDDMFCAFESCWPNPSRSRTNAAERAEKVEALFFHDFLGLNSTTGEATGEPVKLSNLDPDLKEWVEDAYNPAYNLPSKVLFPAIASDVIAAVHFAMDHGLEISVKNSGHSSTGASTKKNTLLLNMNMYTQYATDNGVIDCDGSNNSNSDGQDLQSQPCRLSLAKNKPAAIRVGGGENFNKMYHAVRKSNEGQVGGYKYHVLGGGAGTVSPMGWTFQGGQGATTSARQIGFGVDNVLQIEMVLPNGHHVKFGPTAWEKAEGYDVPKTTSVSGTCRVNPGETEEDKWVWDMCPEDANINFDDLWFAVRGGGGGTFGVITSMHLQVHEYQQFEQIVLDPTKCVGREMLNESQSKALSDTHHAFIIKFLLNPSALNMAEEESIACSGHGRNPTDPMSCYGKGSAQVFDHAWKNYLTSIRHSLDIPSSEIDAVLSCTNTISIFKDQIDENPMPASGPYAGRTDDGPAPMIPQWFDTFTPILVPKDWILNNIEKAAESFPPDYCAFGGRNMKATSDQTDSLSDAHRGAGYSYYAISSIQMGESFFQDIFPEMFDTSDKDNFPPFLDANHAAPMSRVPLKSNWTKVCPLNWTLEERYEKCISLQEGIYGTKLLKRLEAIKVDVDPNFMFDCFGCIGNNWPDKARARSKNLLRGSTVSIQF